MPGHDDHDLERRLRDERSEPDVQFVQRVVAAARGRQHSTSRPRVTLAFALTMALLTSMIAFGGVGVAKNAIHSSTSAVRSAMGEPVGKHLENGSHEPFHKQYHRKVFICLPKHAKHHKHHVKALRYVTRRVSASSVPSLVSKGAIYPAPAGGCSSLNKPTDDSIATSSD